MIQMQTSLEVADQFGSAARQMIMGIGGSTGAIASLGDRIKVTVKEASPDGAIKKAQCRTRNRAHAQRSSPARWHLYSIRSDRRVLIKEDGTPIGTRVFGPWRASCATRIT